MALATYGLGSTPFLSHLGVHDEPDGTCLIGAGSTFISVPAIAGRVVRLADGTRGTAEITAQLYRDTQTEVDVTGFINELAKLGLDNPRPVEPRVWDRISPSHVAWIFSPATYVASALVFLLAVLAVVRNPHVVPTYGDVVWARDATSLSLLTLFVAVWLLVCKHEFFHVIAARSCGVSPRVSLGTRLQFLVVQTDVTGAWALPARRRYRIYLAGIWIDCLVVALSVLVCSVLRNGAFRDFIRAVLYVEAGAVGWQMLIFMRTDLYFVLANALGERDLMADAQRYLRHRHRGVVALASPAVRRYAWFLITGRIVALTYLAAYTIPVTLSITHAGLVQLGQATIPARVDGATTLMLLLTPWMIFATVFARARLRSHGQTTVATAVA